ncbi:30S ribosomal subunit protein S13 [Candidatus Nasuia deltocephalinicola]|uniref:30S ribosomal protein S13 n=1 Tax=Candidatus Nasuia deltocephalincola TaxID=1160784 RepID=A0A974WLB9_9PROT|nr:30S ribosomal protein S13 [Candidatus Nasuia deltocephalinicola]WKD87135.1 30S ribosomal protein S13 [Candidatus Nasuia deltocephalinicola]BEH03931.1 30S ribosomal subunit protein S13 [Candidatus Nasuia deltocephalinicola]
MISYKNYNFSSKKNLYSFLKSIFGIGNFRSNYICNVLNIKFFKKCLYLNDIEKKMIFNKISNFKIDYDLKTDIKNDIKNLINIKCYRGLRHLKRLPVRGQNTRNNSRTRKGVVKKVFLNNKNLGFKKNVKKKKK